MAVVYASEPLDQRIGGVFMDYVGELRRVVAAVDPAHLSREDCRALLTLVEAAMDAPPPLVKS